MRFEKSSGGFIIPTVEQERDQEPVDYKDYFHHRSQHSERSIRAWKEWVAPAGILLPDTNADSFCNGFDAASPPLRAGPDQPRWHEAEGGNVYVIRDVWAQDVGQPECKKSLERCEYATLVDGVIKWTLCIEGVLFADIQPLGKASVVGGDK